MRATVHDVAARAGVSIATVSKALNGLPVSKDSLARVERAAAELGYVVNDAARSLRSERSLSIGLVYDDLRNVLGLELIDAVSAAIEESGYSLLISSARGDRNRYDLLMHRFLERRVDALFCIRPSGASDSLPRYRRAEVPVMALFSRSGDFGSVPLVTVSLSDATRACATELIEAGHRRVAVVTTAATSQSIRAVAGSFRRRGLEVETWRAGEPPGLGGLIGRLAATPTEERPTAILAPDPAVRTVLASAATSGLRIPDDLAVVGLCDVTGEGYHETNDLSSLVIDPELMGGTCGRAMLDWLEGEAPPDRVRIQDGRWVPRGSTATPGARSACTDEP